MHSGVHTGVYKRVSDSKDTTRSSGTACVSVSQCMTVAAVQAPHHTEHTHTHAHTGSVGGWQSTTTCWGEYTRV